MIFYGLVRAGRACSDFAHQYIDHFFSQDCGVAGSKAAATLRPSSESML